MIGPRGSLTRAELFTFVALGLIGAAVFAPQLMQAANAADAAQALADVRTVSRAEQAYAAANAGFYSDVVMLCSTGPECRGISIPGYTGPDFLPAELGRRSPFLKDSYAHHWTAQHPPNTLPASAAPHSVVDYCYVTAPWVTAPIPRSEWPPAFGVDGSGRIFVDRQGVDIACPIPLSTETWDNPRPALAVDFGRRGLWRYDGNDRWIKLARSNPALVHAWGERLLSTFEGKKGLFLLDETGWRRIHPRRPTEIVPMPEGVAVRFRNQAGVWYWDETAWVQLAPWEPEAMEAQGNKLLIDFGREGVWLFLGAHRHDADLGPGSELRFRRERLLPDRLGGWPGLASGLCHQLARAQSVVGAEPVAEARGIARVPPSFRRERVCRGSRGLGWDTGQLQAGQSVGSLSPGAPRRRPHRRCSGSGALPFRKQHRLDRGDAVRAERARAG